MHPRGVAVQHVIPVGMLEIPMVPFLTPILSALSPPQFPMCNLLLNLLLVELLVLGVVFIVVLEEVLMVEGRIPCACQVYMLLVLQVCELPPLHLAGEVVEYVDVQIMNTQGGLEGQARLYERL